MSNEELAKAIQEGNTDLLPVLWEQVERLVYWKANRVSRCLEGRGDVDKEDLVQAGFLAVVGAAETYKPENGAFSTWLFYYMRREFGRATGYQAGRKMDPAANACSLNLKLSDDDENSAEMMDLISDPRAGADMNAVEDHIFSCELHRTVEDLLRSLPDDQRRTLHLRYYDGMTYREAGEVCGQDAEEIRKLENKAMRTLRRPENAKHLKPYIDFDYFCGTGLGSFQHTGLSVQERYMITQENAMAADTRHATR